MREESYAERERETLRSIAGVPQCVLRWLASLPEGVRPSDAIAGPSASLKVQYWYSLHAPESMLGALAAHPSVWMRERVAFRCNDASILTRMMTDRSARVRMVVAIRAKATMPIEQFAKDPDCHVRRCAVQSAIRVDAHPSVIDAFARDTNYRVLDEIARVTRTPETAALLETSGSLYAAEIIARRRAQGEIPRMSPITVEQVMLRAMRPGAVRRYPWSIAALPRSGDALAHVLVARPRLRSLMLRLGPPELREAYERVMAERARISGVRDEATTRPGRVEAER